MPILNSRVYDAMFPDSSVQQYGANIIAENLYSQVDEEGGEYMLMDEILDHASDDTAVRKGEWISVDMNGRKRRKYITKGWNFLVSWKDGTQSWIPLKDMK